MAKKVLVVDDEKLIVKGIRFSLEQDGYEVDCAYDGEDALNHAKENAYDMILLDIMLPKMNGYDATRAIRAMNRNYCRQVPIVAMTANAFAEDVQAAKTVGMNGHIAKPLELKALLGVLKKWLNK